MDSLAVKVEVWIDTVSPYAVAVVFLAGFCYILSLSWTMSDVLAVGVSERREKPPV